jgi:hypothetical protein
MFLLVVFILLLRLPSEEVVVLKPPRRERDFDGLVVGAERGTFVSNYAGITNNTGRMIKLNAGVGWV